MLGAGTVLYALCSPASVGCTTNLVVLTHSQVTARGCAAYSVAAHVGVGLIVLGAVLLLGSFALAVRQRRQAAGATSSAGAAAFCASAREPNSSSTVNSWIGLKVAAYFFRMAALMGRKACFAAISCASSL